MENKTYDNRVNETDRFLKFEEGSYSTGYINGKVSANVRERANEDNFGVTSIDLPSKKDTELKKQIENGLQATCETLGNKYFTENYSFVGACLISSAIYATAKNKVAIQTANVGDCQLFLVTKKNNEAYKVVKLSSDHNADNGDKDKTGDNENIRLAGGEVFTVEEMDQFALFGARRVNMQLEVTRALGDYALYKDMVKPKDQNKVRYIPYRPDIEYKEYDTEEYEKIALIHASDGLEFIDSGNKTIEFIQEQLNKQEDGGLDNLLKNIQIDKKKLKYDDINVIVTDLKKFEYSKDGNKAVVVTSVDGHGGTIIANELPATFNEKLTHYVARPEEANKIASTVEESQKEDENKRNELKLKQNAEKKQQIKKQHEEEQLLNKEGYRVHIKLEKGEFTSMGNFAKITLDNLLARVEKKALVVKYSYDESYELEPPYIIVFIKNSKIQKIESFYCKDNLTSPSTLNINEERYDDEFSANIKRYFFQLHPPKKDNGKISKRERMKTFFGNAGRVLLAIFISIITAGIGAIVMGILAYAQQKKAKESIFKRNEFYKSLGKLYEICNSITQDDQVSETLDSSGNSLSDASDIFSNDVNIKNPLRYWREGNIKEDYNLKINKFVGKVGGNKFNQQN